MLTTLRKNRFPKHSTRWSREKRRMENAKKTGGWYMYAGSRKTDVSGAFASDTADSAGVSQEVLSMDCVQNAVDAHDFKPDTFVNAAVRAVARIRHYLSALSRGEVLSESVLDRIEKSKTHADRYGNANARQYHLFRCILLLANQPDFAERTLAMPMAAQKHIIYLIDYAFHPKT